MYWDAPVETWLARRQDITWTLFYGANWHFIETSQGYFAQYTRASPLLHTWSLAIEEQFYFLWPIAFLAMTRLSGAPLANGRSLCCREPRLRGTDGLLFDSTGLSRAYYSTDGRLQEFLVGAALALVPLWAKCPARRQGRMNWLGASTVVAVGGFLLLDDHASFYYVGGALIFSLVIAALIWVAEIAPSSFVGRVLSLPPVAWIGRISYGLYLWRWFVVIVTLCLEHSNAEATWPLQRLSLTFGCAVLSYYLVERPIREGRVPWLRRSPLRLAIVASLAIALTAFAANRATTVEAFPREPGHDANGHGNNLGARHGHNHIRGRSAPGCRPRGSRSPTAATSNVRRPLETGLLTGASETTDPRSSRRRHHRRLVGSGVAPWTRSRRCSTRFLLRASCLGVAQSQVRH